MHDTKGLLDLTDGLLELIIYKLDENKDKARFTSCAKTLQERVGGFWGKVTYRAEYGLRDTEAQRAAKRAKLQVFIDWCLKYAQGLKVLRVTVHGYASREQENELLAIIQQNRFNLQEVHIDLRSLAVDDFGAFLLSFSLLKKLYLEIDSFTEVGSSVLQHPSLEHLELTVWENQYWSWRVGGVFDMPTGLRKLSVQADEHSFARLLGIKKADTAPPQLNAELQQVQSLGYDPDSDISVLHSFASLISVTFLDLSNTRFEFAPTDIGVLTSLQKLDMTGIEIESEEQDPLSFLEPLKHLTQLQARNMMVNEKAITTVPTALQHYRNLQCLDLSYNNLQSETVLVQLTSLTSLDVSYNKHLKLDLELKASGDEVPSGCPVFDRFHQRPLVPSPFSFLLRLAVNHTGLTAPHIAVLSHTVKLLQVSQDQIGWHCRTLLLPSVVPVLEELRIKDDSWDEYWTHYDSEPEWVATEGWPWYETPLSSFDGERGLLHYCEKLPALKSILVAKGNRDRNLDVYDDGDPSPANIAAIVKSTYSFARNRPDVNFKIVDDNTDSGFKF